MKTFIRALVAIVAIGFLGAQAFAHKGMEHVMGTVKSADAGSLTVTDQSGKLVTIATDDKTTVERGGDTVAMTEVKPGDRVVVHATRSGDRLLAHLVKLARAKPAAPAKKLIKR